ncbi:MAG TPA: response regulator [Rhodopila sp.]|uniref:response regulator transcription factor n=1 Tax=Rhodopila sp. TaxID=2480087 RepID=UPI002C48E5F9|nr:response regulator [Rhodopila sp.]HVY18240.1 response regulator [Rhodopila sp.]
MSDVRRSDSVLGHIYHIIDCSPNMEQDEGTAAKIAIVEDDDAVRNSLRFLLAVAGHDVEAFASAKEFLGSNLRQVACLISDNHMPGMTGLDLIERLRAEGFTFPVLLITANPSQEIINRAAALRVERVLVKPLDDEALLEFVGSKLA